MRSDAPSGSPQAPAVAWPLARVGGGLNGGAFFVLLLVVAMRPLLAEVYESSAGLLGAFTREVEVTTPATTAGFDAAIWLAVIMAAGGALLRRARWQWTGIEAGTVLLVFGAILSTWAAASNKRLAVNASLDWLSAAALWIALANVCRDRRRLALLLAAVTASGVVSSARSAMQVTVEYRETREEYERNKEQIWAGVPPDDPRIELYERRMRANEATGFLSHSNVAGSFLLLAGFAALAAGRQTPHSFCRWPIYAVGAALLGSIVLTGSRGALLAGLAGLAGLALLGVIRPWLRRHWRGALAAAWALACTLGGLVVWIGRTHGGLPGSSLGFRWHYWEVTARIIRENLWTGVGALNFDRAYLMFKPIEYPEEIRDPHNILMSVLAQWGLPGLLGLLLALAGASIVAVRRWAESARYQNATSWTGQEHAGYGWIAAVIAGFLLWRIWLLSGLLASGAGLAFLVFDLGCYGMIWSFTFALLAAAMMSRVKPPPVRGAAPVQARGTPDVPREESDHGDYRLALGCGLAAFLLHNSIDFSLLVPATLTVCAAVAAAATSGSAERLHAPAGEGGQPDRGGRSPKARGAIGVTAPRRGTPAVHAAVPGSDPPVFSWGAAGGVLIGGAGLGCVLLLGYLPVARSADHLSAARARAMPSASEHYLRAAASDPLDPAALSELADRFLHPSEAERAAYAPSVADIDAVLAAVDEALGRDPVQVMLYRFRALLFEWRHLSTRLESDLWAAVGAARRAVELYPSSPDEHLALAELLDRASRAVDSSQWQEEALDAYDRALELDTARPGTDEVRRWPPARRSRVEQARSALAARAVETAPASGP